jgi:hypothetical protein
MADKSIQVGSLKIQVLSAHPTLVAGETRVYFKGDYFVIAYSANGLTTKYRYLTLTGTDATWSYSTSAP